MPSTKNDRAAFFGDVGAPLKNPRLRVIFAKPEEYIGGMDTSRLPERLRACNSNAWACCGPRHRGPLLKRKAELARMLFAFDFRVLDAGRARTGFGAREICSGKALLGRNPADDRSDWVKGTVLKRSRDRGWLRADRIVHPNG